MVSSDMLKKPRRDPRSARLAKDRSAWIALRANEISLGISGFTLTHTNAIVRRVALDVAIHELSSIEAGRPMLHGGHMPPLPAAVRILAGQRKTTPDPEVQVRST